MCMLGSWTENEMKDWASPADTLHKDECTCTQTDTGGASKVATYRETSLFTPTMPTSWCIVALIQDVQAQIIMRRDDDTR